ncbi:flagellar motor stator protein MotA [Neobacillus vireti]|uniref:Flagellar motor protein MotA n=1 Tax=Neobacillus vireti LMG 21834 TaxID=1131730 RepID=A0AB94IKZ6_9BACI|nr:flagellar motor stator protein MotA [Neobacillus vireti]ETI67712.1 flagellar motor protein MotA [Neobacillus vireti LMG 21834]KLT19785.1 flagellar motor protein MotA [Neobacillus vireti]
MSSIFGIVLALLVIGYGMFLKGASLSALINPAAFLIIFGGTISAVIIAFPFSELKKFPFVLKIALLEPKLPSKMERISDLVTCAEIAKKEGILALEELANSVTDPFFKKGLEMVIDGHDIEFIEEVLLDEVAAIDKRHKAGALLFSQAGTYAPTLGVLGAVIGLIASLGNLNNVDKLGHSISAAFIATLLGIFSGYVLWHPIANKLKRLSKQEQEFKILTIEGLLAVCQGVSPSALEKKLTVYTTPKEQKKFEKKIEENVDEKTA